MNLYYISTLVVFTIHDGMSSHPSGNFCFEGPDGRFLTYPRLFTANTAY